MTFHAQAGALMIISPPHGLLLRAGLTFEYPALLFEIHTGTEGY